MFKNGGRMGATVIFESRSAVSVFSRVRDENVFRKEGERYFERNLANEKKLTEQHSSSFCSPETKSSSTLTSASPVILRAALSKFLKSLCLFHAS